MKSPFQLWPAIDLLDGKLVRLKQGDYNAATTYSVSLTETVAHFQTFAAGIHVVDLDGAKAGVSKNLASIQTIVNLSAIPVEVGGGIRTIKDAEMLLKSGVSRVIFGSAAVQNPEVVKHALRAFGPEKVVLGVDARDGFVATEGWQTNETITAESLIASFVPHGLQTVIYTDIATDGMLQGPNVPALKTIAQRFPMLDIIASGGVASITDIKTVQQNPLAGVIFGKAYYEGLLPLTQLQHVI